MSNPPLSRLVVFAAFAALGVAGACDQDPVQDDAVAKLGPEDPNVPPGPTHRPEQPCLVCHGGSGPASTQFSAGGTVFVTQSGAKVPLKGGTVTLVDGTAVVTSTTTNIVGNFFVPQSQWAPNFPVHVTVSTANNSYAMTTHIGRDASCATCHYDPPGGAAVGHVYLIGGSYPDGGFGEGGI